MVLDVSHDLEESLDEDEKKPLDREAVILNVPEYEKDIYQYLREAEVVAFSLILEVKVCNKAQMVMSACLVKISCLNICL